MFLFFSGKNLPNEYLREYSVSIVCFLPARCFRVLVSKIQTRNGIWATKLQLSPLFFEPHLKRLGTNEAD